MNASIYDNDASREAEGSNGYLRQGLLLIPGTRCNCMSSTEIYLVVLCSGGS